MSKIILSQKYISNICKLALNEDLYPSGDITTNLIKYGTNKSAKIISNEQGILAGTDFVKHTFSLIDRKFVVSLKKKNGSIIKKGEVICVIQGEIKNILIGERVALNFLSHISGIATQTNKYLKIVKGKCKICCTRKTTPTLRVIQKYAVRIGGGENHRFNLSDEFLIKDNHISASKNIRDLIIAAIKKKKKRKITVEIDNLKQLRTIIGLKFDRILFDNMNLKTLKKGVKIVKKKYETEASGNVNLKNLKYISSSGVDRISVGNITHSAPSLDFKLEL